jgi:hypothetical protein
MLRRLLLQDILTVMAPVKALVAKLTGRTCGDSLNRDRRDGPIDPLGGARSLFASLHGPALSNLGRDALGKRESLPHRHQVLSAHVKISGLSAAPLKRRQ